jgi:hypothetical protein
MRRGEEERDRREGEGWAGGRRRAEHRGYRSYLAVSEGPIGGEERWRGGEDRRY